MPVAWLSFGLPYFPECKSEICMKFATCDLYCGCEKRGALPSISRMRVAACSACSSLGATGGSMVTRRCSYTAVHMMPSYFSFYCAIFHPCGRSQKAVWRIMPLMCALYKSVCDGPKVRVRLILRATYTPENTVRH